MSEAKKDQEKCFSKKILCSGIIFIFGLLGSLYIRHEKFIDSDNGFIFLVAIFAIISMVCFFSGKITEISIGGNYIKLRSENEKAEKLLKQLKNLQVDSFKTQMKECFYTGSFFCTEPPIIKEGALKFYNVVCKIKDIGMIDSPILMLEIQRYLDNTVLHRQYEKIIASGEKVDGSNPFIYVDKNNPNKLKDLVGEDLLSNNKMLSDDFRENREKFLEELYEAISIYEKLLIIKNWVEEAKNP